MNDAMLPVLLVGVGALLLLTRQTESFEGTQLIKAPNITDRSKPIYSDIEVKRMMDMGPPDLLASFTKSLTKPGNGYTDAQGNPILKMMILRDVVGFYIGVYSKATTPITEATIDTFLSESRAQTSRDRITIAAVENNDGFKKVLKAYFMDQGGPATQPTIAARPVAPPATQPEVAVAPPSNTNFGYLQEAYRVNLAEYRVTGNEANRVAYENARRGLDAMVVEQQNKIVGNQNYIQQFLSKYGNSASELTRLHETSQKIQKEGPKLQDEYERTKRLNPTPVVDNTGLYVKAGVIAGLGALIGVIATR
jgi:hypothetical protein